MADKYASFAQLAAAEPAEAYVVTLRPASTLVAVIAPHGGGIEPGTSEVAKAIAGHDHSLYLFEGMKTESNRDLHITSTRFDEPSCGVLLRSIPIALTVHGEGSASETVYIGGLHEKAITAIRIALEQAGFQVQEPTDASLCGRDKQNICNKGASGAGVQLELPRGLRKSFFASLTKLGRNKPTVRLREFATAVRQGLSKA